MEIREGDIIVCLPGFTQKESDGGAGYQEGLMVRAKENGRNQRDIHWGFLNGNGVFNKALRLANEEEKIGYEAGIRNIRDIQRTTFKISYISIGGETKNVDIEAYFETAAISAIKDLKSINYVMSSK